MSDDPEQLKQQVDKLTGLAQQYLRRCEKHRQDMVQLTAKIHHLKKKWILGDLTINDFE